MHKPADTRTHTSVQARSLTRAQRTRAQAHRRAGARLRPGAAPPHTGACAAPRRASHAPAPRRPPLQPASPPRAAARRARGPAAHGRSCGEGTCGERGRKGV
eukprot:5651-Chlamydomonas_euryale.AAC.2